MAAKTTAPKFRKVESGHHVLGDTGYSVRSWLVWNTVRRTHETLWDVCHNGQAVKVENDLRAAKRAARALAAA